MSTLLEADRPNIFPSDMALKSLCGPGRSRSPMTRYFLCPLCLVVLLGDHAGELFWRLGQFARKKGKA